MAKNAQIYVTENEIAELLSYTDLPMRFKNQFTKDYAAIKRDITTSSDNVDGLRKDLDSLAVRVDFAEDSIASLNTAVLSLDTRVGIVEVDLSLLGLEFDDHVNATEAHGSNGGIVGTDDYCTALVGGTVLLASSIADKSNYNIPVTTTVGTAPAAYNQAYIQSIADMLNDVASKYNLLNANYGTLIAVVNSIKNTQVTAKQRAP